MRHQMLCVWSGLVFLILYIVGWAGIAGFFPPPPATATGAEIAAFYAANLGLIRFGLLTALASCTFFIPWIAVISMQMRRIDGASPVLASVQSLSGAVGLLIFMLPVNIWIAASFRPERDVELILLLNDFGWLTFTMTFAPFVSQGFAIALAILADKSAQPVFPRWAAYFNIWVVLTFVPAALIVYFKTGPFAWTGLIGLWIPLVLFSVWMIVMLVLMLRAVRQEMGAAPLVLAG